MGGPRAFPHPGPWAVDCRLRPGNGWNVSLRRPAGGKVRRGLSHTLFREPRDLRLKALDFAVKALGRPAAAEESGERHHEG